MSQDACRGPGEEGPPSDVTTASEADWDLGFGHLDDFEAFSGVSLTDLIEAEPAEVLGLGELDDPPIGDVDDFPRVA